MLNTPKEIIIHSTDVSYAANPDQFKAVNQYHMEEGFSRSTLGFFVGYHRLITGGKNYQAREDFEEGCHCNQLYTDGVSMNVRSLGVCVGFDGDTETMLDDQYMRLKAQIQLWQDKYFISNEHVRFHRYYNTSKTCPGSKLDQTWLDNLLTRQLTPQAPPALEMPKPDIQCEKQNAIIAAQAKTLGLWQQLWNLVFK